MTSFNKRIPVNFSFDDSKYPNFTKQAKPKTEPGSVKQHNTGLGFEFENIMLNRKTRQNGLTASRYRTLN